MDSSHPQTRTATRRAAAATGSATMTTTATDAQGGTSHPITLSSGTLRLRGAPAAEQRHIQWAEDVVDNEGMGKKSSKVCCIYHKPRPAGESSSESESSSDESDSDSEPDNSRARPAGGARKRPQRRQHPHNHAHDHDHDHDDDECGDDEGAGPSNRQGKVRRPAKEKNAYEKQPKN